MKLNLKRAVEVANKAVLKAGQILLKKQPGVRVRAYKDAVDLVTNADLAAEEIIIKMISRAFPDHNISSEEKGSINKESDFTWYIDPLDGTKPYFRQMPIYNSCLVLCFKNEPLVSAVCIPCLNQLFTGVKDQGAFFNDKKIKVNKNKLLRDSIIFSHPPVYGKIDEAQFEASFEQLKNLTRQVYRLRYEANDNNILCYLASGSVEAAVNFVYPTKTVQDFLPGMFIAQMAGAKITTPHDRPIKNWVNQLYIVSNGQIHKQILKAIKG